MGVYACTLSAQTEGGAGGARPQFGVWMALLRVRITQPHKKGYLTTQKGTLIKNITVYNPIS